MADQDFNIKVVTTADTSGLKQTSADMEKIRQQQATFADTQARIAKANQESQSAPPIPTVPASAIFAMVGAATFLVNGIRRANEEQSKLFDELEKEANKVTEVGHKWNEAAASAHSEADAVRAAAIMAESLAKAQLKVVEIQKQGLSFYQGGAQGAAQLLNVYSRIAGLPPLFDATTYQKSLDQIKNSYAELANIAAENAAFAFQTIQGLSAEFEADKMRPFAEVIAEINRRIINMRDLQAGLNTGTAEGIALWAEYGKQISNDAELVKSLGAANLKHVSETAKGVKDNVKDMMEGPNEFDKEQARRLDDNRAKIDAAHAKMRQMQSEGLRTPEEQQRFKELQDFTSPENQQRMMDELEKRNLERYEGLQEPLIDQDKSLERSLGSEGANRYRAAQNRIGEIDERRRREDPTGGRTDSGSREIVTAIEKLLAVWR